MTRDYKAEYARRQEKAAALGDGSYAQRRKRQPEPEPAQETELEVALRRDNRQLMRQLEEAKVRQLSLIRATRDAASTALRQLSVKPVKAPRADTRKRASEVAIVPLADWQLGKVTPSYNSDVVEERIERLGDRIGEIVEIQRQDHPVRQLWLPALGDLIEGEMIFPGQAHRIDASLFRQVLVDGPRILGGLVRRMAALFEQVTFDGVIGNHGRLGRRGDFHPETNADAFLYEVVRQLVETSGQSNVSFSGNVVDGERLWYKVREVNGKGWLLVHGDQFTGGNGISGFPFPNTVAKVLKWGNGGIRESFDFVLAGHHHQAHRITVGGKKVWISGSTESDNTYASEDFASMGRPTQWLLFSTARGNIGGEYELRLD